MGPEGELKGLGRGMAQLSLAEDFHADNAFARGGHLAHDTDDGIRIGIHVGPKGVDSNEMNFDPGRFRGGAKSLDAVAGAAVSANDSLFLGFGENIHDAFVALGPVAFGKAVHEANLDVVGAKLAAETIQVGAGAGGVAGPPFWRRRAVFTP